MPRVSQTVPTVLPRWFNGSIKQGNGAPCRITAGNEVTELIDAKETFAAMVAAIQSAWAALRPNTQAVPTLTVQRHFGEAPTDPIWSKELGLLAEGRDGALYGAAPNGGKYTRGVAYRVTTDGKSLTLLHHFDLPTGASPLGGLALGADGNFYGTTYEGGKYGGGTIFQITPTGGHRVVWDFRNGKIVPPLPYPQQPTEQQKLDAAGSYPLSSPVVGPGGQLYGVTAHANNQQYGILYTGILGGRYFFTGEKGRMPVSLVAARDGNLYGTTIKGDATCPYGTVFKATPAGGVTALHRFDSMHGGGSHQVMQARDGHLYGTASYGGSGLLKAGVLFRLTTSGSYTVLYNFSGGADGATPLGGLIEWHDGYLYGLTRYGGTGGRGVVFRIHTDGTGFQVVYHFPGNWSQGRSPMTTPMLHSDGAIYGLTYQGGKYDKGVLYRIALPRFIYLLGWWLTDSFPLITGQTDTTIAALFQEAARNKVPVKAMLWDQPLFQNSAEVDRINALPTGAAILDNRTLNLGSHHQKLLVVGGGEGLVAFCGGIDINPDRLFAKGVGANKDGDTEGAPLHDVHCQIKGPAVTDLMAVFTQRWNDHPDHTALDSNRGGVHDPATLVLNPIPGASHWVQVGRTFGNGTRNAGIGGTGYSFAPRGEQSAAQMILHAIQQARRFIYLEEQYFVDTAPNRLNLNLRAALLTKLADPNFQHLTVVIPHNSITEMGPPAMPNQVDFRRRALFDALRQAPGGEKFRLFFRGLAGAPHTYVHAKTWVFDDEFAIIGSANVNRRSWTHDSEVVVGVFDQGKPGSTALPLPQRLRIRLWLHHLGLDDTPANRAQLQDGVAAVALWKTLPRTAQVVAYDTIAAPATASAGDWDVRIDPDGS